MGEIADMMLDGTLCEGCGVYLGNGKGYPQYCQNCKSDNRIPWSQRQGATGRQAVKGVLNLLQSKGISSKQRQNEIISEFCALHEIKTVESHFLSQACIAIQNDFDRFVQWLNNKLNIRPGKKKKELFK